MKLRDEMGSSKSRPENWNEAIRDTKRERILDAAAQVFADRGLDDASMRKIAAQAGCTTGAIYPLFKSKEAMYAELLSRSLDNLSRRLQDIDGETPAQQRLRESASIILDFYLERPSEFALSFYLSAGLKRKGVGAALNGVLNDKLVHIREQAETVMAACVGDDAAAMATAGLFAHITGLLVLQLRGRFHVFAGAPHEHLDRYLTMVLESTHSTPGDS